MVLIKKITNIFTNLYFQMYPITLILVNQFKHITKQIDHLLY